MLPHPPNRVQVISPILFAPGTAESKPLRHLRCYFEACLALICGRALNTRRGTVAGAKHGVKNWFQVSVPRRLNAVHVLEQVSLMGRDRTVAHSVCKVLHAIHEYTLESGLSERAHDLIKACIAQVDRAHCDIRGQGRRAGDRK